MSPFFRRSGANEATPADISPLDDIAETEEPVGLTPEVFVGLHKQALDTSIKLWDSVAGAMSSVNSPATVKAVEEMFQDDIKEHEDRNQPHVLKRISQDARRITDELSLYALITARQVSSHDTGSLKGGLALSGLLGSIPDGLALRVVKEILITPTYKAIPAQMLVGMKDADKVSGIVLGNLADSLDYQPDLLDQMVEDYTDGDFTQDPHYAELQRMIAMDWHRPDKQHSVLRAYCAQLKTSGDNHVEAFLHKIEHDQKDRKLSIVRHMARFALLTSGAEDGDIKEPLRTTYSRWNEFTVLNEAFSEFMKQRSAEAERQISLMAGPYQNALKEVRFPRGMEEVGAVRTRFLDFFSNRENRKYVQGNKRSSVALPSTNEIARAVTAQAERAKLPERRLMLAKTMSPRQLQLVEMSADQVAPNFNVSQKAANDVERMAQEILKDPFGIGTKKLRSRAKGIRVEGKVIALRRFSPDERPGFPTTSTEAKRTRVVYAVTKDAIVLVDVTAHEHFDARYR
jgi:hypothetical protein